MKWIKTAIGAVIAVISIGIIATIVYKMTHSSEVIKKEVSFEIDSDEETYYPVSIYNEILEYGVIDEYYMIPNIVSGYLNNYEIDDISIYYNGGSIDFVGYITTPDGVMDVYYTIFDDGSLINSGEAGDLEDDANIKLVFAVPQPPQLTGISATLILLVPIVFVGGVILYYNPFKKD
jgi:hypothetical protein